MLGAILIVSGPTVVGPILHNAAPGRRLGRDPDHEGTSIDPIGALIGVVVYQLLITHHAHGVARGLAGFGGRIVVGLVGAAVGLLVLWFLLKKVRLTGVLAAKAILATVLTTAGLCDALAPDTGLVAAIAMGMVIANVSGEDLPEDRRQLKTVVQLTIGLLFISSPRPSPGVPRGHGGASIVLVVLLVLVVRPVVAFFSTWGTDLSPQERIFVGAMHPRGIIAASTAASFAPLWWPSAGRRRRAPAGDLLGRGNRGDDGLGAKPLTRALGRGDLPAEGAPTYGQAETTTITGSRPIRTGEPARRCSEPGRGP